VEGTPRDLGGLVDGEPVRKGQIVRVVTTGGGGWGDPLEREPELVQRDVIEGKVSLDAARDEYGVVLVQSPQLQKDIEHDSPELEVDAAGTVELRRQLRAPRGGSPLPMIDRGEGYVRMLHGKSEV
jgi:N-methylhydantoinase B